MTKKKQSEFGAGFIYPLMLYAKHLENSFARELGTKIADYRGWFNGASDHLYELEVPDFISPKLRKKIESFKNEALELGHGMRGFENEVTKEQFSKMTSQFIQICFDIDKELKGNPVKAEWE